MLKEFKEFAMKGNLVDIAVAFVMGAAFNKVVTAFTGGIVSPLIGLIFDTNFKDLKWIVKEGTANDAGEVVGEVAVLYGDFITNLLDFIIVAFVMFMLIKGINKSKKKEEPAPEAPAGPTELDLLTEIRDALKK
ncbi:large conductance mechanosensitive channel protein MscL [Psychroserpens sp.]|uniref:large conductance mechanosensitive channel protein MscL n=1 Tax=Psychroserpens sp. TaxID=2020870 RepID=UPI001AFF9E08|nr:large conductance mechanosensitive channel protein MscL [Psychroserpens sp.]MBO6605280.1 large conductance mechanosensitive channel protein MscL [Psychroserpens sp.]MBO6630259.1 large conductance mechanosensitive channel protein MscL [Psychroserpens sp.]MBO6653911.1 large conductance mechanosensitive channel protein MscL [Psychroserpens sp.]MBO6682232.1 large conductance mechanosensitive channel protein MscL [Psychroserpens sp.]MBO6748654.1 large conductance mechanosensitive channel protein